MLNNGINNFLIAPVKHQDLLNVKKNSNKYHQISINSMSIEEIFDLQQERMMKRKEKINMINVLLQNIMQLHFIQTCIHT